MTLINRYLKLTVGSRSTHMINLFVIICNVNDFVFVYFILAVIVNRYSIDFEKNCTGNYIIDD